MSYLNIGAESDLGKLLEEIRRIEGSLPLEVRACFALATVPMELALPDCPTEDQIRENLSPTFRYDGPFRLFDEGEDGPRRSYGIKAGVSDANFSWTIVSPYDAEWELVERDPNKGFRFQDRKSFLKIHMLNTGNPNCGYAEARFYPLGEPS